MTKLELFKWIYNDTFFGSRVSKRSLLYTFKDVELVDEALSKLFVECPSKFPGESKTDKHYLLKPFWQIYMEYNETIDICKRRGFRGPDAGWTYIKYLITDIFYFWSDWRWYMHPTATSRHGRFFITPNINF